MAKQNYTEKEKDTLTEDICGFISSQKSIRKACEIAGISTKTYMKWLSESEHYAHAHARAMEERADSMFEDILNISDENGEDTRFIEDGTEITNHDVIQRAKLRVEARKWMLGKMQPKKYGDKLDLTSDGEKISSNNNAPDLSHLSVEELKTLQLLQSKTRSKK